ncbi:DUF1385 domain-containing protein [Calditrichota bacterium]
MTVGGQAVMEGVMMRSPWRIATAVRNPSGEIQVKAYPFVSLTRRKKVAGLPVFRGAIGLFEAMKIGIDSLNWSGEIAAESDQEPGFWDRALEAGAFILAMIFGLGLFMAVPYAVAGIVPNTDNQVLFHLVAGTLRILLLLGYMSAISLIPDITRVFQYHGAEHKSIFAFENKLDLNNQNACTMSRFHPRCGTSFLLLAAILTMIGFMALDAAYVGSGGTFTNALYRVAFHLPFIPLVAGLSYEVLRIVERNSDKTAWQPLVKPGFWLQRITTREPDSSQVDVALASLHESLRKDEDAYEGLDRNSAVPELEMELKASA